MAGAVLTAVLLGGGELLLSGGGDAGVVSPMPAPSTSTPPSSSPAPITAAPAPVAADFEGSLLSLPPGWTFEDEGAGRACATRTPGECELAFVLPRVVVDRGLDLRDPRTDEDDGWHLGFGDPGCRASRLVVRELAPIDDKQAEYREWQVDCDDLAPRLRMWWLPRTRLAVVDQTGDDAVRAVVDEIVRTTDLSGLRAG